MDVTLRRVCACDRATFAAWFRDPNLKRWHGNPSARVTEVEFQRILGSRYNFMVLACGKAVGHVAVECDWDNGTSAELGILIDPRHWKRGIGAIALTRVIDWAFEKTRVRRLWAGVASSNVAALRLCERVGLVEERRIREAEFEDGRWIDHLYFAVLAGEWPQEPSATA